MRMRIGQAMGFTLIEIMIVVAIIGLLAGFTVPSMFRAIQKDSIRKAVDDVVEACSQARAQAILKGSPVDVVFTAQEATIAVAPASVAAPNMGGLPEASAIAPPAKPGSSRKSGAFSARLSDEIGIAMLDVNLVDFMKADQARVRFYPNGTSDEFTIVLQSDRGDLRKITLEVTTGLPEVEILN